MFPSPKAWVISYILSGNLEQNKCQTVPWNIEEDYKKFEYTTVLIRSHQSEDRQDDGHKEKTTVLIRSHQSEDRQDDGRKEKDRMTNND